ncbi:hypothetical protein ACIGO6_41100 [Streptomyces sp. NPDC053750]|uniref:hypothetical protein n=1 Tax=Streptomyces sp. NPDC053750 TaxID=3365714 RepID=UPI0037D51757
MPAAYMVDGNLALNGTDWARGEEVYVSGGRPGGDGLPCADTAPETLAPGDSYTTCVAYALPEGVGVLSLTHNADGYPDEGGAVATWPVEGGLEAASAGLAEPGDIVRVRWDAREDGVLELPATLVSVRRGSAADLAGLDLDLNENERRGVPYYVSLTYTNTGPKDLYADQADRVRLTEGGRQIQGKTPFVLDTKIPGCPSDWVARMVPPGDSVTECSIHLVTDDDKPFAVGFAEAGRSGRLAWRAPSTEAAGSAGRPAARLRERRHIPDLQELRASPPPCCGTLVPTAGIQPRPHTGARVDVRTMLADRLPGSPLVAGLALEGVADGVLVGHGDLGTVVGCGILSDSHPSRTAGDWVAGADHIVAATPTADRLGGAARPPGAKHAVGPWPITVRRGDRPRARAQRPRTPSPSPGGSTVAP